MKSTNISTKSNELISILDTHILKEKINLAKVKLIALFISSLCKVQTVTFSKLANSFDSTANSSSLLRHIQRFIASFYQEPWQIEMCFKTMKSSEFDIEKNTSNKN